MAEADTPKVTRGDRQVDELRQQLRALGYLDAGVDRFVLGPAQQARGPFSIAALAAVRIGMLAAVLLGPAAAFGIATRLPGLITGLRDATVVALYLALLFGMAAAAASFAVSVVVAALPVAALARHARSVSRAAGTLVGAACLAYLSLWWRIATPDAAGASWMWTTAAIALAAAMSLLLGHATAITAFAVLVANRGAQHSFDERPGTTRRLTALAGVVAVAGAAALLLVAAPDSDGQVNPPPLPVVSPGVRVRVIAVDGFDPAIVERLRKEGRVPTFDRLLSGAVAHVAADDRHDPARAWTTIATGQPPQVHGVEGLETRRVAGLQGVVVAAPESGTVRVLRGATDLLRLTRPSTASGAELRAKPFWEVAAEAGLRVAVVNWWATWPASERGANPPLVISERATLRLELGGTPDGEIAPAAVYDRLRRDWADIKREAAHTVASVGSATGNADAADAADALRRAAEVDAVHARIVSRLDVASFDLLAVYLPGLDIAQHALLNAGTGAAPSALSDRLEGLVAYYVYLDTVLKDLASARPGELVLLVTQPGRVQSSAPGLAAASGEGAAAGASPRRQAIDLAPTILHGIGVPISRELAGAPMLDLFSRRFQERYPVRAVESYGRRTAPPRQGQPLDQEMIERLKSLGYVR